MRGSARDVASSLTRLNTTNQSEPPYILSYKGGNRETPVLSLCVSPLPSLAPRMPSAVPWLLVFLASGLRSAWCVIA